jgi:hypothetical protein
VTAPYQVTRAGLALRVRVTPNAAADRIEGIEIRDDGEPVLKLRVAAVPDKGKANAAVIALVAKALSVPKSAISLVSGETARTKTVEIVGRPEDLALRLAPLLGREPA